MHTYRLHETLLQGSSQKSVWKDGEGLMDEEFARRQRAVGGG